MNNDAPGLRMAYEGSMRNGIYVFIIFGLLSILATLWLLYRKHTLKTKYILLVVWGIFPPMWFLIEYFFIYMPYGVKDSFVFFQYGQDIASKLWGAVFALISIDLYKANEEKKKTVKKEEEAKKSRSHKLND
ncbi:MAG: hypothetical protein PHG00_05605 [Methylococcales bacterium]|nr:hypothetical protein [Methylococcales bacterium]